MQLDANILSLLSHELRDPLNSMSGIIEQAMKNINDENKLIHYLNILKNTSDFMLSMNDNILEMCCLKKMMLKNNRFSLSSFLDEISSAFKIQTSIKQLSFTITKHNVSQKQLVGDTVKLRQILANVIGNAVKYTPVGGKISLICNEEIRKKKASIRFIIKDNGMGISPDLLKNIFRAFARENNDKHPGGLGLGLYITKELINFLGGTIDIKSVVNEGTTITFTLPFTVADISEKCERALIGKKILVADDCLVNVKILEDILKEKGIIPDTVSDGLSALNKYLEAPDYYYDLIIVDINMPKLDGINVAYKIRHSKRAGCKQIPILALSSGLAPCRQRRKARNTIDNFLLKPVKTNQFFQEVNNLLF